jgi:hypothetical protein
MKHEIPSWLAEALALIGAFILLITQAKRITSPDLDHVLRDWQFKMDTPATTNYHLSIL